MKAVQSTAEVIVCEVSSFQLTFCHTFRPSIAPVLNVADDHYDWHTDYDDYLRAKARIARVQTAADLLAVSAGNRGAAFLARQARARPAAWGLADLDSVRASAEGRVGRPLVAVAGIEGGAVVAEGPAGPAPILEVAKIRL